MFNSTANTKLSLIIDVAEKLENCQLKKDVLDQIEGKLSELSKYLGVSPECALFFSLIFVLQNQNFQNVSLHDISNYLDFSFLHILEFRSCLDALEEENLIYIDNRTNSSPHSENNGYRIHGSVSNNIIDGTEIIKAAKEEQTTESVLDEILTVQSVFSDNGMNSVEYNRQILNCEKRFAETAFVRNICALFPDDFDSRVILYNLCCDNVMGCTFDSSRRDDGNSSLFSILPRKSRFQRRNSFRDGNDILFEKNFVKRYFDIEERGFHGRPHSTSVYQLTTNGIKQIFGDEAELYLEQEGEQSELDNSISLICEMSYEFQRSASLMSKIKTMERLEENNKLDFVQKIKKAEKKNVNRFIIYECMHDFLQGNSSSLTSTLSDFFGHSPMYFSLLRSFLDEKHPLLAKGFLEINKESVVEKCSLEITDKTIELFYGKNADIYKKTANSRNVLNPEDLREKKLFYSDEVNSQIDMLAESLNQKNLVAMQKRLENKGLCKGISVILFGAPGTGKTETVYQLAKRTNRQILHVDIADSKSMWFGESEKQIKKIFTNYRSLCKSCKSHRLNTPILLFNEADAIISKRKEIDGRSAAQTENAMQNILLEEMEKFDGILIATTNLCENMDKAFERRFLFKIKYEKPTEEARRNIWKSKLSTISEEDAEKLASLYDFSGGEIDNIVRKCEMNEIIKGEKPDFELLKEFCSRERLESKEEKHIGFGV